MKFFETKLATRLPKPSPRAPLPRWVYHALILLGIVVLIPPVIIVDARNNRSRSPRIHPIPDMDNQVNYRRQKAHLRYADGRAARPPIPGTVARGQLALDTHKERGVIDEQFVTVFPPDIDVDTAFLSRGQERYGIYCAPCHGFTGYGEGTVSRRAAVVSESTWVPPTNLHLRDTPADPVNRPAGYLFLVISNGVRNMPGYGAQIPVDDRWAIVAYVRALQRSQHATLAQISADDIAESDGWPVEPKEYRP